jgi:gliding motility-associated-like protein
MKRILFFVLTFFITTVLWSQTCTMNISTRKVCLGNTVSFSVSVSGGTGTISYLWNFGNSATSTQATPIYQYTSAGTFTPTVTVTFSGGGNCVATGLPIQVFTLPQTRFSFTTSNIECFGGNFICIKNTSIPGASNAPLDTGNLNWDDGTKMYFIPTFGQVFCHSYSDPFGGIYTPVIEIADTNGCLSRLDKKDSITVFPKMGAVSFATSYTLQCPQTPVKYTNLTAIPRNQIKSFKWDFGDGSIDTVRWDTLTHIYTKVGNFDGKLFVTDVNNCTDSFVLSPAGSNTVLDPRIYISTSSHTCFRNNSFDFYSRNSGAQINWSMYYGNVKIDTSVVNPPFIAGHYSFANCGTYHIKMYVNYPGSTCKSYTDSLLDVYGPNAIAQNDTAKIINQIQCQIHDTVFFRTPVPYLMCHNDNLSMIRIWNFGDVYAPQCTTDTKNGINVNRNCNWSKDSMNVWHYYTPGHDGCYTVTVFMQDTIRGCWDSDTVGLKLTAPSAHWDSTVTPIRRGVYYEGNPDICIGSQIIFHFDQVLPLCGYDSAWLLPDSACHGQWIPLQRFQNKITYTYQRTCDSSGWVTYGAIVKNGLDNSGNTCYDTAWYHFKLFLLPINPAVTFKVNGTCQPYTIQASLVDSIQDSITKAEWTFETRSSYLSQQGMVLHSQSFTQVLLPPNDSIIHGHTYISPTQGVVFVTLKLTNTRGCVLTSQTFITLGFMKDIAVSNTSVCLGDSVGLFDYARYYTNNRDYWADSNRAKLNLEKVWWDIGDGKGFSISKHYPVIRYTKTGVYTIRLVLQDSLGCKDTITAMDKVNVLGVDPQIKKFDTIQYCAPFFLNLVDSSIVSGVDSINSWEWIFSDGKPRSLLQNPQHEFTSNGKFTITLNVITYNGCKGTITKNITIKGPQPKFDIISDTVGCRPFTAKFRNTTGYQLINWQWNFRDQNNTILSTTKDTDITFTYTNSGIYKIRLFGQDTIRDPATNTLKTCRAYFPDTTTELPVRLVRVLPGANPKIFGPDSICPNQVDTFIARCDSSFKVYNWIFGDGNSLTKSFPDSVIQKVYVKSGVYKMALYPMSADPKACTDTAYKTIFVNSVKADFSIDESQSPLYHFNDSSTNASTYKWFIGTDITNPAKMFSQARDTSKTITDTGAVMICLQAFNDKGCWDTTCKEVHAKTHVMIYNVFTPDNNDGLNDAFDIDIVGYTKYELIIFNRWGTPVFRGDRDGVGNDGINWNGRENNVGAQCSPGTYFYIFNYKLLNDVSEKTVHGTVTLIRSEN